MKDTVIVSAARTAIDDFGGPLKDVCTLDLGKTVILEAIKRAGIDKSEVDEVIMGNVLPGGLGPNPARWAMLKAGLPVETAALTVNKVCGSGLKAIMLADQAIKMGDADVVVAGGMEGMYQVPYYLPKARDGYHLYHGTLLDGVIQDGLWDMVNNMHMGYAGEVVAQHYNVSREEQDRYALCSYQKAQKAIAEGRFKEQIVPVEIPQKKGPPLLFDTDEVPQRQTTLESLARLPAVYKTGGTITAGNATKICDGAAAVVVMSREKAEARGIKPLARIVAHGAAGIDPMFTIVAPTKSVPKILTKAGLTIKDIDLFEINEPYALAILIVMRELGIDAEKINVNGGAVALGHPLGCSGARILVTLLYAMKERGANTGMASICLGGGEAVSMVVER